MIPPVLELKPRASNFLLTMALLTLCLSSGEPKMQCCCMIITNCQFHAKKPPPISLLLLSSRPRPLDTNLICTIYLGLVPFQEGANKFAPSSNTCAGCSWEPHGTNALPRSDQQRVSRFPGSESWTPPIILNKDFNWCGKPIFTTEWISFAMLRWLRARISLVMFLWVSGPLCHENAGYSGFYAYHISTA